MHVLQICLLLLGLYIFFCVLPAIVIFLTVFRHRTEPDKPRPKDYYEPYAPLLDEAVSYVSALPMTEVSVTAKDGILLKADYYNGGHDRTALLFHGYRATPMGNCARQAALLAEAGYNLLLVHQRAHGKSGGHFTSLGYIEQFDVLSWVDFAAAQPLAEHLVLYGVSMGAVGVAYASDKIATLPQGDKVRALVLDCGFTAVYDQLAADSRKLHVPTWTALPIVCLLYRWRFGWDPHTPTAVSLAHTRIPALVIHGQADKSVPFSHGEAVFASCGGEKEALFVPDAAHTCALLQGGDEAQTRLLEFFRKHIPSPALQGGTS